MPDKDKQRQDKTSKDSSREVDYTKILRSVERDLSAIEQTIGKREFKSVEEINAFLEDMNSSGKLPEWVTEAPLEKAQELIYDAWETVSKRRRVKLAHEALKICSDCADAYLILAEDTARSIEEACELYKLGMRAGERALGVETFSELVGHFWGVVKTRPYMRARAGFAECLCQLGRHEEAVEHYWAMLRLNPNDNQGIRYLLAACLLVDLGDIESLLKLLKEYDGDMSATWHYTGALATFIHQGNSPEARRRLKKALKQNPHVIPYLLLGRRLPRKLPEYVEVGGESEAVTYCADFGKAWYKTEGAITWLKAVLSQKTERQRKIGHSAIPEVFLKAFQSEEQLSKGKGGSQNQKRNMVTIYIFKVSLEDVPEIWRKIEIGGNQTLHQLHEAIFKAFERLEERPYAFFLSGKRWDSSSEYGMPGLESKAKRAKIGSLGLRVGKKLLYVFDFEYERWHSLELLGIGEEENTGKYPRIVES